MDNEIIEDVTYGLSDTLSTFIKFSFLKNFVTDLYYAYTNSDSIKTFYDFLEEVDVQHDMEGFVEAFQKSLDENIPITYLEGVEIDIPMLLKLHDENYDTIISYIKEGKKIYENPAKIKEIKFLHEMLEKFKSDNKFKDCINEENCNNESDLKLLLTNLNPIIHDLREKFNEKKINVEFLIKIMLFKFLDLLNILDNKESLDDTSSFRNITYILLNCSPLNQALEKKSEILNEFVLIKNSGIKLMFQNIFSTVL